MFLAFAPEMLDDWLRRANREAAAAAASMDDEDDGGLTDPDDTVTRQGRVLARLYREMHASAKDEFAAAQQVFPKPSMVLEMFLSRLLEQNVQAVLERLLLPSSIGMATLAAVEAQQQQQMPPQGAAQQAAAAGSAPGHSRHNSSLMERASNLATSFTGASGAAAAAAAAAVAGLPAGASAAASAAASGGGGGVDAAACGGACASQAQTQSAGLQRQQLRLIAEAYGRTQRLASNLEKSVRPITQLDVVSMAEGLWPSFLGSYPEQELLWLQAACAEEVGGLFAHTLDCVWTVFPLLHVTAGRLPSC
jgi:hypothetical protein